MITRLERLSNVWFAAFVLPWIVIAIYLACVLSIDPANLPWFHSEVGPVELVSALLFLPMCYLAGHVAYRLLNPKSGMSAASQAAAKPWLAVAWFALFALGSIFMFLEETSFGQHVIGFESPAYFKEHNKQQELSLHNLAGDKPSSTLRQIANTGLPIFAIVLPLVAGHLRKKREASPDSGAKLPAWIWLIMPGWELALWVILAALVSPVRKLGGFSGEEAGHWRGSLSEFKEMLWYCALLTYAWSSYRHHVMGQRAENSPRATADEVAAQSGASTD